jgi:ABC-type transport system substrate-binding protein
MLSLQPLARIGRRSARSLFVARIAPTVALAASLMAPGLLALGMAGCGGDVSASRSGDASASGLVDVVTFVDKRDPNSLDPALMWDAYDGAIGAWVHQGLTRFAEGSAAIEPALAESWEFAPDGLSATFKLRESARFHDGSPVTAWDVKYSVTRVLDPAVGSQRRWMFEPYLRGWDIVESGAAARFAEVIAGNREMFVKTGSLTLEAATHIDALWGVMGVEIVGPREIRFHFEKPYLPFLTMLAMPNAGIIPLGSAEAAKARGSDFSREPIGAGPWKLASWDSGVRMEFTPFADYWEGPPAADRLVYRAIDVESTWRAEFDAGNVDFYLVSAADHRLWTQKPEKSKLMVRVPELNIYFLGFNTQKPKLADPRVRRALTLGLNRPDIFEHVALGRGELARGPVPPGIEGFQGDALPSPKPRVDEAKRLLAEAGAEGLEVSLYHQADRFNSDLMQNVRADWEKIGVQTLLKPLDRAAFEEARRRGEPDVYYGSWWADYPDIDNFLFPLYHSSNIGGSNGTFYKSAEVDALIDQARFLADPAKRLELFREVERRVVEDAPMIFLWHRASYMAVQPRIQGYKPHPMLNGIDFHGVGVAETR